MVRVIRGLVPFVLVAVIGVLAAQGTVMAAAGSTQLKDIPANDPNYAAIQKLVSEGWLAVYDNNTFGPSRAVDRYTLAVVLERVLDELEKVKSNPEQLNLLRELANGLRQDLAKTSAEQSRLSTSLDQLSARVNSLGMDYSGMAGLVSQLNDRLTALEKGSQTTSTGVQQLNQQLGQLGERTGRLDQQLVSYGQRLESLEKSVADLLARLQAGEQARREEAEKLRTDVTQQLESRLSQVEGALKQQGDNLVSTTTQLQGQLGDLSQRLAAAEKSLGEARTEAAARAEALEAGLEASLEAKTESLAGELKASIEDLSQRLASAEVRLGDKDRIDQSTDERIQQLAGQLIEVGKKVDVLDAGLRQAISQGIAGEAGAREAALGQLRAELEGKLGHQAEQTNQMAQQLEEYGQRVGNLETAVADLLARLQAGEQARREEAEKLRTDVTQQLESRLSQVEGALKQQGDNLVSTTTKLQEQLGALSQRLAAAEKSLGEARTEAAARADALEADFEAKTESLAGELKASIDDLSQRLASAEVRLGGYYQNMDARIQELASQLSQGIAGEAGAREAALGQLRADFQGKLDRLQADLSQSQAAAARGLADEAKARQDDVAQVRQELAAGLAGEAKARDEALSQLGAELKGDLHRLEAAFEQAQADATARAEATDTRLQKLEQDLRAAFSTGLAEESRARTEALAQTRSDLETAIAQLRTELKGENDKTRMELAARLDALEAALASVDQRLQAVAASLEAETKARQELAATWEQRWQEFSARLEALKAKVDFLSGAHLDVSGQLAAAFNNINLLQRGLDQVKTDFDNFRTQTSEGLSKLNKNLYIVGAAAGLLGMFVK